MKRIRISILAILILCGTALYPICGMADAIDSIAVMQNNTMVKVEGTLASGSGEQIVTLEVLAPGKSAADIDYDHPKAALEVFSHIDACKTQAGKFTFTFPAGGCSGEYTVRISSRTLAAPVEKTFQYYTAADYVTVVNSAKNAEEFMQRIQVFLDMNQYTDERIVARYEAMEQARQAEVYTRTTARKAASPQALIEAFEDGVICAAIQSVEGYGLVHAVLAEHNDILLLDFTDYDKLDDKSAVNKKIAGKSFSGREEIRKFFEEAVKDAKAQETEKPSSGPHGGGGGGLPSISTGVPVFEDIQNPDPVDETEFSDLDGVEWAVNAIRKLSALEIIVGDGTGNFHPQEKVTREQFVKMLISAFFTVDETAQAAFTDVSAGEWSYPYIAAAQKLGLVSGYADGSFGLRREITRQEVAVFAYRAARLKGMEIPEKYPAMSFADEAEIADYAREAIAKMQQGGIIRGVGEGSVAPGASTTRAEAAQIIYGLMTMEEAEHD